MNPTLTPSHLRVGQPTPSFERPDPAGEEDEGAQLVDGQQDSPSSRAPGASLLCEDDATRRRMLDMEHHLRPARASLFVLLAVTLIVLGPSIGWWPLAPLGAAVAGFLIADRVVVRSARPEYCFMGAWAFAQLMIGLSVVLTGGPRSLFLPWLALPASTLAARFGTRGVVAGATWTLAIMVAASVGVNPAVVAASPARLLVPVTLLAGVTLLSTGLMRSDVKHRAASLIDPLTGLFNRQALTLRGAELVEQARVTDTPIAVMIGDLDHFKRVNDRHGHLVGDEVLREVANTLRTTLRTLDHVYRYGGEEFVVLLPGNGQADALAAAERLRLAVTGSHPAGLGMTMSFGVGVSEGHDAGFDELLFAADRALYRAKAAGRDCVRFGVAESAVPITPEEASSAALEARPERLPSGTPATPSSAFAAAQRMFLGGQRVEMQALADGMRVSIEKLYAWCGQRDQLLGEIIVSLFEEILRRVKADHTEHVGADRFVAIYREYLGAVVHAKPLQTFFQNETQFALKVLTSPKGYVQPRAVQMIDELLREEQQAGALRLKTDRLSLSYAIVRLSEGFLYDDTLLATEPRLDRVSRIVALLLD